MAELSLQAESDSANPTINELHAAYRYAKAQWELATYHPDNVVEGLPDDVEGKYCDACCDALDELLLHPAADLKDLALKMGVFQEAEIIDNWHRGPEIVAVLVTDVRRLASEAALAQIKAAPR